MGIEIACDFCDQELESGDLVICNICYSLLEDQISELESEIADYETELLDKEEYIGELENRIIDLEDRLEATGEIA